MPLADASRRLQRRGFDVLAFNSAASMAYDNALPVVRLADGRYGVDPASVEAERVRRQRASFSQKLVSMGGRMAWGVIGGLFHR